MHPRLLLAALGAAILLLSATAAQKPAKRPASPPARAVTPITAALNALSARIHGHSEKGRPTAETLAGELAELDRLLTEHPEKNDDAGQIALMRAAVHLQIIGDEARGVELMRAVKNDYPGTQVAVAANRVLDQHAYAKAQEHAAAAARQTRVAPLLGQPAPELHFKWSSRESLKTLSSLRGRVVVLDFWTTSSSASLASLPHLRNLAARFKEAPVTFLGVTSIQGHVSNLERRRIDTKGDEAKETALMRKFIKTRNMTWPVVFTDEPVLNPAYLIDSLPYLAIVAPDGTIRHAALRVGSPEADISGKIEAILREFNLALPHKS
ncbi:MAG TPA: TlpA disulfide reductase family protein [Lacunisphaera sp.]|nr:TlpA disulfide reductase family protein [Lacunisphaera sp.]